MPAPAYWQAISAGLCIGAAEVCYFYILAGSAFSPALSVSVATTVIVGGAVLLPAIGAWLFFGEHLGGWQWLGAGWIVAGLITLAGQ